MKDIRICILVGRAQWAPHSGNCVSRQHSHTSLAKAAAMVEDGRADWERETYVTARGKERRRTLPAIRVATGRRWRKTICRDGYSSVAVMQLVAGG